MKIGNSIKELRKHRGLTQVGLATSCETTQEYISNIERNVQHPSKEMLKKIADALKVPEELFFVLSMDEEKIPEEKREQFRELHTAFTEFFDGIFEIA